MWRFIRILSELLLPLAAAWCFAATFKPEAPWAFGRPVENWAIVVIRILAAVLCIGMLVKIAVKLLELVGFVQFRK